MYTQPRLSRPKSWKLAAGGAAALVLLVAGVLAYPLFADDAAPEAPATTAATAAASPSTTTAGAATAAATAPDVATPAQTRAATPVKAAPAAPATVSLGVVSGAPLVPVTTSIRLDDAQGLGSASIRLTYDPLVLTIVNVENGNVPKSALTWTHDAAAGVIVMLLTTSIADGATGDHSFAVVTLEAKEGAVGETSPLTLSVRSAALATGAAATLDASSGTFRNGVPGDVLGDGTIDKADYERLASWLVGEDTEIVALNADLDGDGAVTDADAVRLHQFLDGTRATV